MKTILVVEDNPELRENTVELLELAGYKVITAVNGNDGYEKTLNNDPNLILCDILMPELGGIAFLKRLRENRIIKQIPFIFFSAGSVPPSAYKSVAHQPNAYLQKPFTSEELFRVIDKCH